MRTRSSVAGPAGHDGHSSRVICVDPPTTPSRHLRPTSPFVRLAPTLRRLGHRTGLLGIVALIALTGCASSKRSVSLSPAVDGAEVVFVGKIRDVGEAPGTWSTYYPAMQTVVYEVEEVWKGRLEADEVSVDHVLVYGSALSGNSAGGLDPALFTPSERLIVFARAGHDRLVVDREEDGVVSFTRENERDAKRALALQAS